MCNDYDYSHHVQRQWLKSSSNYYITSWQWVNQCFWCLSHHKLTLIFSLVSGRCDCNLRLLIFKLMWRIDIQRISCEIARRWMPQDLTEDKSALVQLMAWCHQETSNYLKQCWPRSMSPYSITSHNGSVLDNPIMTYFSDVCMHPWGEMS